MRRLALPLLMLISLFSQAQDLSQFEWMIGNWETKAFNSEVTESWNETGGNFLVGAFSMSKRGEPILFEFMVIRNDSLGNLELIFNHFDPELNRMDESLLRLPLIEMEEHKAKFQAEKEVAGGPRSLLYRYDPKEDKMHVLVEEWERTSAGYESFSLIYNLKPNKD